MSIRDRIEYHLSEMEEWLDGTQSYRAGVDELTCSRDVSALTEAVTMLADAQQAAAHALAAQALAAVLTVERTTA